MTPDLVEGFREEEEEGNRQEEGNIKVILQHEKKITDMTCCGHSYSILEQCSQTRCTVVLVVNAEMSLLPFVQQRSVTEHRHTVSNLRAEI